MTETLPYEASLARMIDHTLLRPDACESEIIQLCHEARTYQFASVCVYPSWVQLCVAALKGSLPRICTVIGFPHGANQTDVKVFETDRALKDGAMEVDMVMHVGRLKQGDSAYVEQDIAQVAGLVREASDQAVLKVILETCMLDAEELSLACRIAVNAGADFVKTSTGFAQEGATVEAVQRMRHAVGEHFGVKASGGIRDRTTALAMIEAGANRLGSSSGLTILQT